MIFSTKIFTVALFLALGVSCFAQTTHEIPGNGADLQIYENETAVWIGQKSHRVGLSSTNNGPLNAVSVFVFELPELDAEDEITSAHMSFNMVGGSWATPLGQMNLYGLGYRNSSTVQISDYFFGPYGSDTTDATALQADFGITWPAGDSHAADGPYGTDSDGDLALLEYLTDQYAAGAAGGDFIFLRLNHDTAQTANSTWTIASGDDSSLAPVLTIVLNGASVDEMPQAMAGADQAVSDDDENGEETVTLDGSASFDPDGTLVSYIWSEGGSDIAAGETAQVSLAVGEHTITLTVTDDSGYIDTDTVVITVLDAAVNIPPVANAGSNVTVTDTDGNGSEDITLDGTASSDPDGTVVSYEWKIGTSTIANGPSPVVALEVGQYTVELTVTDEDGDAGTDHVIITINAPAATPLPLPDPDFVPPIPPDPTGNQLLNLYGQDIVRPETFERTWPAQLGQMDICLYEDDKFAAINLCIDDNTAPDHQWWRDICATYGINVTWVIVIDALKEYSGNSFFGSWPEFRNLHADGFHVQSHSVTHQSNDDEREDYLVHYEYAVSKQMIELEIPGNKVRTIAYPYGNGKPELAALYFIAARGTIGTPNRHNNIDYMNVHSGGSIRDNVDVLLTGSSTVPWHDERSLRGWMSHTYHFIQDREALETDIAYAASKKDQLWIGTFEDIAMYCQERDTAVMDITEVSPEKISFTLTDRMMDTIFTYPLTVKVNICDIWNEITAIQNGQSIDAEMIEHEGTKYALVKAVPDAGEVIIEGDTLALDGDADVDGDVDIFDFLILKSNFGTSGGASWTNGDFDGDGDVDIFDFLLLKSNFGSTGTANRADYFIDYENGSDSNDGRSKLTAWKHCPGDVNATDNAAAAQLAAGDFVLFKGGVRYFGEIRCNWSGQAANRIVYDGNTDGNWGTGRAIIDGSKALTGWTQCQNADEVDGNHNFANIYWTYTYPGLTAFNTNVFEDNKRLHPAQDPNLSDPFYYDELGDWVIFDSWTDTSITAPSYFTQAESDYWNGSTYMYIHAGNNAAIRKAVTGYDPVTGTLEIESLGTTNVYSEFAMVNSLKILDLPGELVVREDRKDGDGRAKIYIWPFDGTIDGKDYRTTTEKGNFCLEVASGITVQGFELTRSISNYDGGVYNQVNAGVSDITIDNNLITWHADNGVNLDDVDNCVVSNNEVTHCSGRGIILTEVNNSSIEYNYVHDGGETAIDYYTAIDSQIVGNLVENNLGLHANGITCYIYCENVLIYGNNVSGGRVACTVGDCENMLIAYNILDGNGEIYAFADWRNQDGLYLYNNIILNGGSTTALNSVNVFVRNNVMAGSQITYRGGTSSHNIYTELSWTQDANNLETGEFMATPDQLWLAPANGDYHHKADSPAIDAGMDLGLNEDLEGNSLFNGSAPDIGVYEY